MKHKIVLILSLFISTVCFSQTAENRRLVASMLNNNEAFAGNVVSTQGASDLMLVFSGPAFDSYLEIVQFINSAGWDTWVAYYDTIGFKAMCFLAGEIDKCYVKSEMLKIISY